MQSDRKDLSKAVTAAPLTSSLAALPFLLSRRTRLPALLAISYGIYCARPALRRLHNPKTGAHSFTLVSSNILYKNSKPALAARDLLDTKADVLVLVEHADSIAALIPRDRYPFRLVLAARDHRDRIYDVTVLSALPMRQTASVRAGTRLFPVLELAIRGATCSLVPIHLSAPHTFADGPAWKAELDSLGPSLADLPSPLVVCGDFNASLTHTPMRGFVKASGLAPLALRHRRGLRPTWGPLSRPAVLPIDHILVSASVSSRDFEVLRISGSDHRALKATLSF